MNKTALLPKILDEMMNISRHPRGALGCMEDCEKAEGYTLVPLGSTAPFAVPSEDWEAAIVSLDGTKARMVLLHARQPRSGALRRLVSAIQAAGFKPALIEPTGPALEIMAHWGWRRRRYGYGFDSFDEYQPSIHAQREAHKERRRK